MRDATPSDYRWLYAHGYMPDGLKCADGIMLDIVKRCPGTFLDFGCGRGQLADLINKGTSGRAIGWDPIGGEMMPAVSPEWIISCDVLEHVEPQLIDATLAMLGKIARRGLLLTIANMNDFHKVNGEDVQLHLIRKEMGWWTVKLSEHFPGAKVSGRPITCNGDRFAIVVEF